MSFLRWGSLCVLLTLIIGVVPPISAAPVPFPDMETTWYRYREAVDQLRQSGAIEGYPDGTYRPKDFINRAEFLKIVFRGRSDVTPVHRRCFSDINPDAWYAPYVCAAQRRGIVKGYPDGTYQPERTINMAEAIKIILLAYGRDITEYSGPRWYAQYVDELEENDIMDASSFLPWEELNRERAADLLWRVLRFDVDREISRFSPGCGKAAPAQLPVTVTVEGRERSFLLTIPENYVTHDPLPLIVAFHGRTNSNEMVRQYYRLDRETDNYIIAYPAGLSNGNGSYSWADPGDRGEELRGVAFFDAIVEKLAESYCIDMDHIYTVGHSLGAWIANSVACIRGDVIRGSATVGGTSVITDCSGPSAAFIAHNPEDRLAPFSGSEAVRELRVGENFCAWETDPGPSAFNCVRHQDCVSGNDVLWCPHSINEDHRGVYYPHNWPRQTAELLINFFESLP